jgi:CheY-like chemotaxis protein
MQTILVVDDNAVSRELMRAILKGPDRRIVEAGDGREALERIAETRPDLVLLDVHMPVLDGFSVLRALRADPRFRSLRVIAVTANAMQGEREKALDAGFDGYVTKPVSAVEIRKLLEQPGPLP